MARELVVKLGAVEDEAGVAAGEESLHREVRAVGRRRLRSERILDTTDEGKPPIIAELVREFEQLGFRWAHRVVQPTAFWHSRRSRSVSVFSE